MEEELPPADSNGKEEENFPEEERPEEVFEVNTKEEDAQENEEGVEEEMEPAPAPPPPPMTEAPRMMRELRDQVRRAEPPPRLTTMEELEHRIGRSSLTLGRRPGEEDEIAVFGAKMRSLGELKDFKHVDSILNDLNEMEDRHHRLSERQLEGRGWPLGPIVAIKNVKQLITQMRGTMQRSDALKEDLRKQETNNSHAESTTNKTNGHAPLVRKTSSIVRVAGGPVVSSNQGHVRANEDIKRIRIVLTDVLECIQNVWPNIETQLGFSEGFDRQINGHIRYNGIYLLITMSNLLSQKISRLSLDSSKTPVTLSDVVAQMEFIFNVHQLLQRFIREPVDPIWNKWLFILESLEEKYITLSETYPSIKGNGVHSQLRQKVKKEVRREEERDSEESQMTKAELSIAPKLEHILNTASPDEYEEFYRENKEDIDARVVDSKARTIKGKNRELSLHLIRERGEECKWNEDEGEKTKLGSIVEDQNNLLHLFFLSVDSEGEKEVELFQCIVEGSDVNYKNMFGETPLHIAMKRKLIRMSEMMIGKGADLMMKDNQGQTPMQCLNRAVAPYAEEKEKNGIQNFYGQGDMSRYLYSKDLSDVTFSLIDPSNSTIEIDIPAHRIVLCAQVPVFRAMLEGDQWIESRGKVVIRDVHPAAFRSMMEFCYTGRINLSIVDRITDVLVVADRFDFAQMKERMKVLIPTILSDQNVFSVLSAPGISNMRYLEDKVSRYILDRYEHLREDDVGEGRLGDRDYEFLFRAMEGLTRAR
ncbi:TD and POZ domain-containing protein 2-like [Planoprotostelium fungivorum]|uniref:TD and POZ domain-containing protein 2-like n=1 Tax=Planoprotostelium fungivorum TaxID=1890364 RepID=A0A2P6NEL6_9EUKA|nr:TD and POZ domain-containing protein 2-like [Planoprotostelium fungivorum]